MTLYGALADDSREGKGIFGFKGKLSPLGVLDIETPFAKISSAIYIIHAGPGNPPDAPVTAMCTFQFSGSVVTAFGWMHAPGIVTPLAASDGEEDITVIVIGKKR